MYLTWPLPVTLLRVQCTLYIKRVEIWKGFCLWIFLLISSILFHSLMWIRTAFHKLIAMLSIQEQPELRFHNDFVILQALRMLIYMQSAFWGVAWIHDTVSTVTYHIAWQKLVKSIQDKQYIYDGTLKITVVHTLDCTPFSKRNATLTPSLRWHVGTYGHCV